MWLLHIFFIKNQDFLWIYGSSLPSVNSANSIENRHTECYYCRQRLQKKDYDHYYQFDDNLCFFSSKFVKFKIVVMTI